MCGIAGIVGDIKLSNTEGVVQEMIDSLARRGPDGEGIECWETAILGHRRLAIFDLSDAGRQPFVSEDHSLGVVFNGAIYNYRELRKDLQRCGYKFLSHTDTEILIHGYHEWGVDSLVSRLRGMFAFGLWDNRLRKLFLVRDRLGVKPLVYFIGKGFLAFASTVRSLRVAGFLSEVDGNAITEFLELGFISQEHGIYRGVVKVPQGTIVEWSDGRISQRKFWVCPEQKKVSGASFNEIVEEVERIFLQAVEIRLQADVPIAALLSGGIDSSLICWAITQLKADVTAYTIGTPGDQWDETTDAIETAKILGIQHHILEMSGAEEPEIDDLISAYGEPFGAASALGMLRVSRMIPSSIKVLLTGDGGDDVFLGYPQHRHLWLAGKLSGVLPISLCNQWFKFGSVVPRVGPLRRAAALLDYASGDLTAFTRTVEYLPEDEIGSLLGGRFTNTQPVGTKDQKGLYSKNKGSEILSKVLNYDRVNRFEGEYLTKVDGATMYYGLEARSPFLDHILWEFASALTFDQRLYRGNLKAILRALAKKKIGMTVANRPKKGFGIPVRRWIVGRWLPLAKAAFHDSILQKEGWINADVALRQLDQSVRDGTAPDHLWHLLILEFWMRQEKVSTLLGRSL